MQQGICNPEFYGDLVYKFKKIIGSPNFSNLLKRIANRFKRAGYSLDIMRQTACLVFNPIMVEGSGSSPGRGMTDFCTSIFICLY